MSSRDSWEQGAFMFCMNLKVEDKHHRFLLAGDHQALADMVLGLEAEGWGVGVGAPPEGVLLPQVIAPTALEDLPGAVSYPWLVWNVHGLEHVRKEALESGALCVLERSLSPRALLNALHTAAVVAGAFSQPLSYASPTQKRHFERGEQIHLEEDRVVHIRRGIVRCSSIHPDGSEVLIGFYGEGDALLAHASHSCHSHSCHVEMRAHTSLSVSFEPWTVAVSRPDFYDRLKERICQMEVWASMQARATMEGRLLGLLEVIAGRFSHPIQQGIRLDIRLTHEQLAGAIGATRTTVTRLLGDLKKRGVVQIEKTANGDYFVLATAEVAHCHH